MLCLSYMANQVCLRIASISPKSSKAQGLRASFALDYKGQ